MRIGPGAMVAAAFIGPGTVVTAATAGATSGGALLWAVGFSVIATLVLQDLAARSALATRLDLASLIRTISQAQWWRLPLLGLVVVALGVGNSAYQSGNLTGAGLGIAIALDVPVSLIVSLAAVIAGTLILVNRYDWLEKSLSLLVALMGVVFVGLAIALFPEFAAQTAHTSQAPFNALAPQSITLTLALIGTTVVPYNLFLHAAAANKRWSGADVDQSITQARVDAVGSIMVGGLVTAAIVIVGAVLVSAQSDATPSAQLITAVDDRYGLLGRYAMGVGLFAAGLTSAIAAPVAGGWAVCGAVGWSTASNSTAFRAVALSILSIGTFFALFADRPIALILSAQVTNALILLLMALLLLLVINNARIPKQHRNTAWTNVLGALILLIVTTLALAKLWRLWG